LELESCLQVAFKRSVDKNSFIGDEADTTLREICKAATETKLLAQLQAAAGHRRQEIRAKAVRCLAMLAQRLAGKGPSAGRELKSVADLAAKALTDANPDVRQSARMVAMAVDRAASEGALDDCSAKTKLQAAIPPGVDLSSFDAFDVDAVFRTTPSAAQSGARGFSRQGSNPVSLRAAVSPKI
jgi:hypothetical protein